MPNALKEEAQEFFSKPRTREEIVAFSQKQHCRAEGLIRNSKGVCVPLDDATATKDCNGKLIPADEECVTPPPADETPWYKRTDCGGKTGYFFDYSVGTCRLKRSGVPHKILWSSSGRPPQGVWDWITTPVDTWLTEVDAEVTTETSDFHVDPEYVGGK
jgi:hypothetical protein